MSYSFSVRAPNKRDAIDAVYEELNKVAMQQAPHRLDVRQAQHVAREIIDVLGDDEALDVTVSMSGYITTVGQLSDERAISISCSISASQAARPLKL